MLSKSAQYRRLLKMHGAGQQASLAAGAEGAGAAGSAGSAGAHGGVANDGCQMCEFVVQYIKIALANNETMAQVGLNLRVRVLICVCSLALLVTHFWVGSPVRRGVVHRNWQRAGRAGQATVFLHCSSS